MRRRRGLDLRLGTERVLAKGLLRLVERNSNFGGTRMANITTSNAWPGMHEHIFWGFYGFASLYIVETPGSHSGKSNIT